METVLLDGESLTLAATRAVAEGAPVQLEEVARPVVEAARAFLAAALARGDVLYGINTGFGALSDVSIAPEEIAQLQVNLVRSHACGVGTPLPVAAVRAMMAHRANVLLKGYSGCRWQVIETLAALLNAGVTPVVPSRGSVGASGDLAPLAHLALVLIGEGEAVYGGTVLPGGEALERAGIAPLTLEAKEGLALLNGTQAMTAVGGLAVERALRLTDAADVTGALSLEALRGTPTAFDARIHAARPHPGQQRSARRLRELLAGSEIRESHRDHDPRVQDAYAIRCMPQVHGAVRDTLEHARRVLEIEINSATDNPLVFAAEGDVLSGGNFHGEPVALAFDSAAIAVAALATIAERRVERLVNPALSGLPAFLTPHPGTNSGLMMVQVTAASLIAENNVLTHPATTTTLPTSANKEDHVSMGMTAALKLEQVVTNVETVLAIELLCAAQGIEFLRPLRTSPRLEALHAKVRSLAPKLEQDRPLAPVIEQLRAVVRE